MKFSDETVEKFYAYWEKRLKYLAGFDYVPTESEQDFAEEAYKAALSSITLADLMRVDEVRAILERAVKHACYIQLNAYDSPVKVYRAAEVLRDELHKALTPPAEAK
jgi:hypothetical protein